MRKLRVLDLFSGIGGFSLGLERTGGFETAAFCEYADFPRKVLAKHWPGVRIYPDVRELTAERLNADGISIDVICGGYPCQPFSNAGKRRGAEDDRHLWPEMCRLIASLRPAWVIGENVAGHISMGLDDVLSDLDGLGYAAQAFVIPACAVNAPHRRDRVWIVANAVSQRSAVRAEGEGRDGAVHNAERHGSGATAKRDEFQPWASGNVVVADASDMQRNGCNDNAGEFLGRKQVSEFGNSGGPENMANSQRDRLQRKPKTQHGKEAPSRECARGETSGATSFDGSNGSWWDIEPSVGRVANGVPHRVDRLKALGNAVVPQIPEMIGRAILKNLKEAA